VQSLEETLAESLAFTSEVTPEAFPRLLQHFASEWVEEALLNTQTATLRRRRLPAEQTVWLVLGMALLRDLPITAVAQRLELVMPAHDGSRTVASSALTQARARLGAAPMEWLFTRSAETWAHRSANADRWRGLALYGVDGTTLRVADSDDNRAHFGGQDTDRERHGQAERRGGYPWAEGVFNRNDTAALPHLLPNDERISNFMIRIADNPGDLATAETNLHLVLFRAGAGDQLEVKFNDVRLSKSQAEAEWKDPQIFSPDPQPASGGSGVYKINPKQKLLRLSYRLDPRWLRQGANDVQVRVKRRTSYPPATNIQLEKLEVTVAYSRHSGKH